MAELPRTLIADIGGTTSRFALAHGGGRTGIVRLRNDDFPDFTSAASTACQQLGAPCQSAVLAVAGPVGAGDVRLTNRAWTIEREVLRRTFGWTSLRVLNDFEAVAYALPAFGPADLRTLAKGQPELDGRLLALGPGTGLGAAVYWPQACAVQPTEAGHVSFGPAREDEEEVFRTLRARLGFVSAEMILSGPGLIRLHDALHGEGDYSPGSFAAAAASGEVQPRATLALFARLLGRFAGDMALAFQASGGVYVAGGVAQKLAPLLDSGLFMDAFLDHPPHRTWLERCPVHLVMAEEPGLIGCAAVAAA